MSALLADAQLHDLFMEIHFGVLDRLGATTALSEIEALLRAEGFVIRWVDFSHLHANRSGPRLTS